MASDENTYYYIDSHFHLAIMGEKGVDISKLATNLQKQRVMAGIDIGVHLEDADARRKRIKTLPGFGYSIGLYPSHAAEEGFESDVQQLRQLVSKLNDDPALLALGEMGMDFHWNYGTPEAQEEILIAQLDLASEFNLPVIIHNREADDHLYRILAAHRARGIMHCFSSDYQQMKRFLDIGMYISFAGNLTFKNAGKLQDAARRVPLDRVLFETDSPFLTPVPHRGSTNTPEFVPHIYQFFAELRNIELSDLCLQVAQNFSRAVPRSEAIRG
jgi:TatD DNase family protein